MDDVRPPALFERLLGIVVGVDGRYVVGDLREEYTCRRQEGGRVRADFWYVRESLGIVLGAGLSRNLSFAGLARETSLVLRTLRRRPAFTAAAVLTIGLMPIRTVSSRSGRWTRGERTSPPPRSRFTTGWKRPPGPSRWPTSVAHWT